MLLSQLFRKHPVLIGPYVNSQVSTFKPTCAECQKYRDLIKRANDLVDSVLFVKALRKDFEAHVEKEHSRANRF